MVNITKEQGQFLFGKDISSLEGKLETLAEGLMILGFKNEDERRNFTNAIKDGNWNIESNKYVINIALPLNQTCFIRMSDYHDPVTGGKIFITTNDFSELTSFTKEEISENPLLEPYNNSAFLINEYEAVKKYGNLEEWFSDDDTKRVDSINSEGNTIKIQDNRYNYGEEVSFKDKNIEEVPLRPKQEIDRPRQTEAKIIVR